MRVGGDLPPLDSVRRTASLSADVVAIRHKKERGKEPRGGRTRQVVIEQNDWRGAECVRGALWTLSRAL
jgi:hypothetical protein